MTAYPEHEKLEEVQHESQTIGEFLEWLTVERQFVISEYINIGTENDPWEELVPSRPPIEQLLAEYFEIDLQKLSEEKDAIVEEYRQMAKGVA